ncbi:hypothetical protein AA0Z99_05735 [Agrococcus sp. 1P02AA]|uniref:hypothetical protein n=1 Tax=Agrococcus sp. 1P02AA TaxID=3132259 RepID=UPI0039A7290F
MDEVERARTGISFRGIQADAYFAVRLLRHLNGAGSVGGALALVMAPWWSTYLHESRRVLGKRLPQLVTPMSKEASAVFEHARHGVKMFLDSKRNIGAYEAYFDDIAAVHRERFLSTVNPWLRPLAKDLGVTTYESQPILTTHGAAFATGLEPMALLDKNMGTRLRSLWEEGGQSFAMAALAVDGPPPLIVQGWDLRSVKSNDVVASNYYGSVFAGSSFMAFNAVLLHYLGMVNTAHLMFPMLFDLESDEYAIFKMRYLVTTHVAGSLAKLAESGRHEFAKGSASALRDVVEGLPHPSALKRVWLRNLLVHYEPHAKADVGKFDRERLLGGIIAMADVPEDVDELVEQTNGNLAHLAASLNAWMAAP